MGPSKLKKNLKNSKEIETASAGCLPLLLAKYISCIPSYHTVHKSTDTKTVAAISVDYSHMYHLPMTVAYPSHYLQKQSYQVTNKINILHKTNTTAVLRSQSWHRRLSKTNSCILVTLINFFL